MAVIPLTLTRFRDSVTREMQDILRSDLDPLYSMLRYHLGWEAPDGGATRAAVGKMFRPILCLLCCEAVGGDFERALPAAAAVEFAHNFSLVHDDIEDSSRIRHGRRAVWDVWGIAHGINTGDAMFCVARLALHRLAAHGFPAQTILNAILLFDRACQQLCEGQDADLRFEERERVSAEEYLRMVAGKTGALIAAAAGLGAVCGDAQAPTVRAFDRFGRLLGRSFQIRDDVLGVWGDEEHTGKPCGEDIRSRKKSYPIVRALEVAGEPVRRRLLGLYADANVGNDAVGEVLTIFDLLGVRADAEATARQAAAEAMDLLAGLALRDSARHELTMLTEFVAARDL